MNEIIIYGAGKKGVECLDYMKWRGIDSLCRCFADRNFIGLQGAGRESELGKEIIPPERLAEFNLPVVVAINDINGEVLKSLCERGIKAYSFDDFYKAIGENRNVHIREYLAYVHARSNDVYFENAEEQDALNIFWGGYSPFLEMFNKLDLSNVIELACGWGRHVKNYYDRADKITLVDILQENIDICKKRFAEYDTQGKICYYKNDGYDYGDLKSGEYTAVFSYDAMVHFEMLDVYSYLCDTYRILKTGGMALFHHSNYGSEPEMDFRGTIHARNYMTSDLFRYLVYRSGLEIVEQRLIDWDGNKELDCLSLLVKRN